jgi:uncharacterized membrane protein (DUF485 family)
MSDPIIIGCWRAIRNRPFVVLEAVSSTAGRGTHRQAWFILSTKARVLSRSSSANSGRTKMEARSHVSIQRDPDYQELVRRRSSLGWTLSLIMLVIYFGFILLVAYAPKFLGMRLGTGVTTIGIPIGLFVIVSAFVLTGIYVSIANSKYDALIRRIVER